MRSYSGQPLTLQAISQLLWAAAVAEGNP
ncbi:hypothetical protein ACFLV5_02100 [Chloroflexota bacterium]